MAVITNLFPILYFYLVYLLVNIILYYIIFKLVFAATGFFKKYDNDVCLLIFKRCLNESTKHYYIVDTQIQLTR